MIGHLSPERARFLEYDLTRLIHDLATPKKPVVALLGDLPLFGDRTQNLPPATVIDSIRGFFELRAVMGKVARFDDDVDVVMIAQAARIDIGTLYALDQLRRAVLQRRGGRGRDNRPPPPSPTPRYRLGVTLRMDRTTRTHDHDR